MNRQRVQSILIVDDDPSVADTFSRLLRLERFTTYTAFNPHRGHIAGRLER
ncbi:MAG TPA: hypothetical protein QF572_04410 [Vicinamibacterales bacterium]|jgi:CheY-like chemotaxis protein|nr:hypothetical protein [Vicinamibacterales bacterium]|tara:strand:- start:106 stop:258 length:153 start_codon:yes stop_codon:yes gene_type:complete